MMVLMAPGLAMAAPLSAGDLKTLPQEGPVLLVAGGHLTPDMGEYDQLVDSLKSGQTMAVVQYGRLSAFGTQAKGGWATHASGSRRFTLRYVPAEGTFKIAAPGEPETTLSEAQTLQDLMFSIGGLPLVCRHGLECGQALLAAQGTHPRLLLGVSWEPVVENARGASRWLGGWVDLLTLRPLWQKPVRVEGEVPLDT